MAKVCSRKHAKMLRCNEMFLWFLFHRIQSFSTDPFVPEKHCIKLSLDSLYMNLETESDFSVCLLMKVLEHRGGKIR